MKKRDETIDLARWIGHGLDHKNPANDADSTDLRFNKLWIAFEFWKYMPSWRIKAQTFAERIEREAILKRIREFESRYGVIV